MRLIDNKRWIIFPIQGCQISKIVFDGFISLHFSCDGDCILEIHGNLQLRQHGQAQKLDVQSVEALSFFHSQFREKVKMAKADHHGHFWLEWENGAELYIEDGPYENWHFTLKAMDAKIPTYVHGGVGRTSYNVD